MSVFRIVQDKDTFGYFNINDPYGLIDALGSRGYMGLPSLQESIIDKWPGDVSCLFIDAESETHSFNRPDLYVSDTALVLSARAKQALGQGMAKFGEYLPIWCDELEYYLFIAHVILPVNETLSEINYVDYPGLGIPPRRRGTKRVSFRPEDVGTNILFKTPFDNFMSLFCSLSFKQRVEGAGLKGIFFDSNLAKAIA